MRSDARPMVQMNNGSMLMAAPRGDEYWVVDAKGEAAKVSIQEAVRIWLRFEQAGNGRRVRVPELSELATKQQARVPSQPPPIPPEAQKPGRLVDHRASGENLETWQSSLMRKLGLDHETIEDAVAADRVRHTGG